MKSLLRNITLVFAAGALGGLLNSLAVWGLGTLGITESFGVKIAPSLTPAWLYPRVVWGGIWGAIFLLPIIKNSATLRGLVFSLGPTLVQLFVVFPNAQKGMMGLSLGTLTPAFVVLFNAIWGLGASYWLAIIKKSA